jgi:hypothetical protein
MPNRMSKCKEVQVQSLKIQVKLLVKSQTRVKDYCKQRPPVDYDHTLFVPLIDLTNKLTCQQRPPDSKTT